MRACIRWISRCVCGVVPTVARLLGVAGGAGRVARMARVVRMAGSPAACSGGLATRKRKGCVAGRLQSHGCQCVFLGS